MFKNRLFIFLSIYLFFGFIWNYNLNAEEQKTGTISGTIVSSMTNQPLIGVTVRIVDTQLGTYSKEEGKFSIKNVPVGRISIHFSYVGYQKLVKSDIQIVPNKTQNISVSMTEAFTETEEITVKGSYFTKIADAATGTQSFSSEDIRNAPGVQEDAVRALQLLPGVNSTAGGRNDLIVRGGAPFENLYIIDGIEVPNINHFSSQGSTGGPLSIINIDFVENVEFSAGGFGARFGDKVSSMTNISMRSGNKDEFRGRLDLSATGVDGSVEGPLGNGSYFVSARRSYLDFLFNLAGFSFVPQYWDFNGKIDYQINSNNIFKVIFFGVLDDVTLNNENLDDKYKNSSIAVPSQQQYIFGATWKHLFKDGYFDAILSRSFTRFSTFQNDSNLIEIFKNESKDGEIGLKTEAFWMPMSNMEFTFGNNFKIGTTNDYDIIIPGYMRLDDKGLPQELTVDSNFSTYKNATYANVSFGFKNHKVSAGLRGDYFNTTIDKYFISPRLSVFYNINENSTIISSLGRYYQSPSPIWFVGSKNQELNPIKADQIVLGYAHTPLEELKVQLEFYYKWYDNYPARVYRPQGVLSPSGFDNIKSDIPFGLEPLTSTGEGLARGVELFIQKKMSDIPIWGLLSLTLSESKFTSIDGKARYGAFDTRFIGNLSVGWRINENWEFSGKFKISTGVPTTPFNNDGSLDYLQYNEGERLPLTHQLDIRLDKRWILSKSILTTYIDIQNAYNRNNISSIRWDEREGKAIYPSNLGILPSIGILFEF